MGTRLAVNYHPVSFFSRFSSVVWPRTREVYYIGGADVLPAPLNAQ